MSNAQLIALLAAILQSGDKSLSADEAIQKACVILKELDNYYIPEK